MGEEVTSEKAQPGFDEQGGIIPEGTPVEYVQPPEKSEALNRLQELRSDFEGLTRVAESLSDQAQRNLTKHTQEMAREMFDLAFKAMPTEIRTPLPELSGPSVLSLK